MGAGPHRGKDVEKLGCRYGRHQVEGMESRLRNQAVGMRGSEVEAKRERNRAVGMTGMMIPVRAWREL